MARTGLERDSCAQPLRLADAFDYLGSPEGIRWVAGFWFAIVFIEALARAPIPLGGLAAFVLRFIAWFMLYRIASETLLEAADDTPGLPRRIEGGDGLAWRHVALWLIGTLALVALTLWAGPFGTALGALALLLVLPAATILLTLGRSLLTALWPPSWLRLAARLGRRDYGLLCGALLGIGAIYALTAGVGRIVQPDGWLGPIAQFTVWSAGVLGWFHLAGRAVAVHREDLNLTDPDTEVEPEPERFTRDPDALWEEIRSRGGSRAMHAELARHLVVDGPPDRRLTHGRMHIEALLLAFEDPVEAVDRSAAMLDLDPGFCLSDAEVMRALVVAAADQDHPDLAMRFAENFLAVFANSAKATSVRLRACELLADRPEHPGRALAADWLAELNAGDVPDALQARLEAVNARWARGA
ncbi:hypothetical protein HFP89_13765 [Wenzhouxiangella sp. XN79A]|uniref:hypothetical protein n=1 Tax=Wenzhouxiangella sp. XN79A TaxID=2724193 RepID=UPI00144AB2A6|nr:hypothetical protein [Wenzhouxiangella sp. XN79A]NKI36232.1 hypothetical protein [Wenzhouxiangella sp. XN79A]